MKVYFISGLGADKRIFSKINLDKGLEIIHIEWIKYSLKDSLKSYAKKFRF